MTRRRCEQLELEFPDPDRILRERRRPWTTTELAMIVGCSRFTVLRHIHDGIVEARRVGARFVIDPASAHAYFQTTLWDPQNN